MRESHTPVLVVGAGPVGMAIAAMLRRHGLKVRIIDKGTGPTPFSKAVGMHARTLEAMHALGITEQLIADGRPLHRYRLNEEGRAIMSAGFTGMGSAYEFVLGLPQRCTEQRLLARLQAHGSDVQWQTQLIGVLSHGEAAAAGAPAKVVLQCADGSTEEVSCNWLIGADGGRSAVRDLCGIGFDGGDYGNAFILGDVRIDWDGPRHELQFFLSRNGYLLVVPMPDGLHRIIAQTGRTYDEFQKSERPVATLEELQGIVDRNGPGGIRVHSPEWLTCAPFYHRLASTPLKGRVLLAGDAFHLFSPLGAQGLNTGFQDAFNIAWKLAYIEKGWAPMELINTYASERVQLAKLIGSITTRTTRYITATSAGHRLLRQKITSWLNPTARIQQRLPRLLAGLMQSYGAQTPLSGPHDAGLPAPGGRVPHAWVSEGHAYRPLASLIHGTSYTLLLVCPRLEPQAIGALSRFWNATRRQALPFLQVALVTRELNGLPLPDGVRLVEDRLGEAALQLAANNEASVLVRPDGYAALALKGWCFDAVSQYFRDRHLGARVAAASLAPPEASHAV